MCWRVYLNLFDIRPVPVLSAACAKYRPLPDAVCQQLHVLGGMTDRGLCGVYHWPSTSLSVAGQTMLGERRHVASVYRRTSLAGRAAWPTCFFRFQNRKMPECYYICLSSGYWHSEFILRAIRIIQWQKDWIVRRALFKAGIRTNHCFVLVREHENGRMFQLFMDIGAMNRFGCRREQKTASIWILDNTTVETFNFLAYKIESKQWFWNLLFESVNNGYLKSF